MTTSRNSVEEMKNSLSVRTVHLVQERKDRFPWPLTQGLWQPCQNVSGAKSLEQALYPSPLYWILSKLHAQVAVLCANQRRAPSRRSVRGWCISNYFVTSTAVPRPANRIPIQPRAGRREFLAAHRRHGPLFRGFQPSLPHLNQHTGATSSPHSVIRLLRLMDPANILF
jgi:hypothetical protein